MKAWAHLLVAGVLSIGTAFFTWIWIISGNYCDSYSCGFDPGTANLSFVSLGYLCAFMEGTEIIAALRTGNVPETPRQRNARIRGAWLVLAGSFICFAGFYEVNNTLTTCPSSGCSQANLLNIFGPLWALFYSGIFIIAYGGFRVMRSRFVKNSSVETIQN